MSMIVNGVEIPKNCAECPAGTYEYNDNDERCFVCGFIKSQHPWECEHAEIDGIDTNKMRAYFCPIAEVATPHWIPCSDRLPDDDTVVLVCGAKGGIYTAIHNNSKATFYGWWKLNSKSHYCDPIAWMPLPEVYKGE